VRSILVFVLLSLGCAHSLDSMVCAEACARHAVETGHNIEITGWKDSPGVCGCRFDDGQISYTCERPAVVEGVCQWSE
jgi:hypothetical protein